MLWEGIIAPIWMYFSFRKLIEESIKKVNSRGDGLDICSHWSER
jgi:hypothetical protein